MKNVCLILIMLLMVHMSCEACTTECESCLRGEPTTLQVVIRDLSMGSLSGVAADLGMFDLADALLQIEEVTSK